jgi:hypothetical protein
MRYRHGRIITLPFASVPWTWNTDLATSRPIVVTACRSPAAVIEERHRARRRTYAVRGEGDIRHRLGTQGIDCDEVTSGAHIGHRHATERRHMMGYRGAFGRVGDRIVGCGTISGRIKECRIGIRLPKSCTLGGRIRHIDPTVAPLVAEVTFFAGTEGSASMRDMLLSGLREDKPAR